MKRITSKIACAVGAAVFAFGAVSLSCSKIRVKGTADTVFADTAPAVNIPNESLKVVEALQSSFNSISAGVLPSVVEIDVTEKRTVKQSNPFEDFEFFFFGNPLGDE